MKRLFWDIETSPNVAYTWSAGRKLTIPHDNIIRERAVICIAWKWENEKSVHCETWNKGCDKALLKKFAAVAMEADELVAHNGDRFDLRWFNARNLFHRLPPLPQFKTVDTLAIARARFYLNSFRLDYISKFLGGEGKLKTDFGMWKAICEDGCQQSLARMVRYCKRDVIKLQEVWEQMAPYHRPKSHAGVVDGRQKWTCPHDGSRKVKVNKHKVTAAGTKQHGMQCGDCGRYFDINDKTYRNYLEEKP